MARKKEVKIEEVIIAKDVVLEKPVEVEEEKIKVEKNVRILLKDEHKCFIGGEWYYFEKGKCYNVPQNVKEILMKANKLLPL